MRNLRTYTNALLFPQVCRSQGDHACALERARLQPRYRGLAHTIGPREIGLRSAFRESLDGLLTLMRGQNRGPPKTHATGLARFLPSPVRARISLALELSKAA